MRLELKMLAGYLPYGLKIDATYYHEDHINELVTMISVDDVICDGGWASTYGLRITQEYSIEHIKPILHPLSDLTKEIEVNGEKFVPMEKLAKIEGNVDTSDSEYKTACQGITYGIRFNIENDDNDDVFDVFGFDTYNGFGRHKRPSKEIFIISNQIELWNKLYEWHFDIHGLIENGLAIDINTI